MEDPETERAIANTLINPSLKEVPSDGHSRDNKLGKLDNNDTTSSVKDSFAH